MLDSVCKKIDESVGGSHHMAQLQFWERLCPPQKLLLSTSAIALVRSTSSAAQGRSLFAPSCCHAQIRFNLALLVNKEAALTVLSAIHFGKSVAHGLQGLLQELPLEISLHIWHQLS